MAFSRNLLWLIIGMIPFFLFSGCGDLEPEMQDTRSVVLKMDFNQRSSSRSSQTPQDDDVNSHKTHLILALNLKELDSQPALKDLSISYRNYDSITARKLMNPLDKTVYLEIPTNTQMKIFAFLFKKDYTMLQLTEMDVDDPEAPEVGYYGQLTSVSGVPSQTFSIDANTNDLTLGITLKSAGTDIGGDTYTTIAPIIETVTAVTTTTSNSTPNYTFASTKAGSISYGGSCYSATIIANIGNNTIIFNALIDGYYDDCTIKVTDSDGNESNTLTIPPFTVDTTVQYTPAPTVTFSPANGAIGVDINGNIIITFSEAVRNIINNTELTDSNIDSHITLKNNDASGSTIDFDATINTDKKVITINPTSNLPNSQAVYVAIGATLEDYADNLITAANATFTTAMDPSLEAYYPFNGNPNDESGNSYHGQLGDNVTTSKFPTKTADRYGNPNQAFYFDGGDYIALNKSVTYNSISEITVCAWVLSTDNTSKKFIISFDRSESYRLALKDSGNTNVGWDTTDSSGGLNDLRMSSVSYEDGNWHHICGWYNSSNTTDKKIFVDGDIVASDNNSHSGNNLGTTSTRYGYIGWGSEASSFNGNNYSLHHRSDFMIGKIDDVRIYSRALSDSEISALYLREKP